MSYSLQPHRLYSPWNSSGQNTGVGSLSLLQEIDPTQGSNLGLLHCRWILYQLRHKGSPRILEWVSYSFSSGSSWPRNCIGVSFIAEKEMATHSSTLAWKIPWMEEPGRLQSMGPQRVGDNWMISLSFSLFLFIADGFFNNWAIREAFWLSKIKKRSKNYTRQVYDRILLKTIST